MTYTVSSGTLNPTQLNSTHIISHTDMSIVDVQGLYAMSINCMEAAEAQFKTALMVIYLFYALKFCTFHCLFCGYSRNLCRKSMVCAIPVPANVRLHGHLLNEAN